tara:strand:- start:355 stop:792 length:438 start_codon:yes stop_codon:yes gene_type:complete
MKYAIIDGTTVKSSGTIYELFPQTSFPKSGPNASFISDNNLLEITEWLTYTTPSQKLTKNVDVYVDNGKAYNCKVEATTTEERTTLINSQWSSIREQRDEKLQETDWRASSDLTLSDTWKTYRQALRDITTQSDPFNITWPTKPT